jgi:hypothetical protein
MSTSSLVLRKLQTLRERPSRIADRLREPRPLTMGGPLVNRMGLQVVRAYKEHAAWSLRSFPIHESIRDAYDTIERDGVIVIPNFLPDEDFRLLQEEYQRSRTDPGASELSFGENLVSRHLYVTDYPERYPHTMRLTRDSEFLLDLASAVSRRRRTFKPHLTFYTLYKPEPNAAHTDLDSAQFAHPDRHYRFLKAFLYLNDVDENNAPYSFAKGSHRFTLERLRFEYEHANKWANRKVRHGRRTADQIEADAELERCVNKAMLKQAMSCEPIVGKANTLIVSNNQGFHKRGPFNSNRERQLVAIDYKYLESAAQWMYPVLKRLYPKSHE